MQIFTSSANEIPGMTLKENFGAIAINTRTVEDVGPLKTKALHMFGGGSPQEPGRANAIVNWKTLLHNRYVVHTGDVVLLEPTNPAP